MKFFDYLENEEIITQIIYLILYNNFDFIIVECLHCLRVLLNIKKNEEKEIYKLIHNQGFLKVIFEFKFKKTNFMINLFLLLDCILELNCDFSGRLIDDFDCYHFDDYFNFQQKYADDELYDFIQNLRRKYNL